MATSAASNVLSSSVKRERFRREELKRRRDEITKNLPVLNSREVRRFRIPYHQALTLELEEDGFLEAATFFSNLIKYQEDFRNEAGPESFVWFYPQLINEKDKLDILQKGLQAAEAGKLIGKFRIEIVKLLEIGVYFSNLPLGWWWLALQLLLQAVACATEYKDDGGRMEAVSRYILGRFYLNQLNEVQNAIEQLKTCRDKSVGKPKWNASEELGIPQKNIYIECCTLLYRALLIVAKTIVEVDPVKAARLCQIGQNRAKDAEDEFGISECLLQLGICELKNGNANTALVKFNKVLTMSLSAQSPDRICEARIQIALAQSRLGNIMEANYHLEALLEYAAKNDLMFYFGQAHRFLGELYLNEGQPKLSTSLLIKAVEIFHDLNDLENEEQVKNLAAISAGQELFPRYVDLILSCENNSKKQYNIIKMVKWKDNREIWFIPNVNEEYSQYCVQRNVGSFESIEMELFSKASDEFSEMDNEFEISNYEEYNFEENIYSDGENIVEEENVDDEVVDDNIEEEIVDGDADGHNIEEENLVGDNAEINTTGDIVKEDTIGGGNVGEAETAGDDGGPTG